MTKDSAALSLDLANDFSEAEESQTRHKEPTSKNIQAEDGQSNNEMMEILNYMKSEISSLKRKQEALEFASPSRLKKRFPILLDLTNKYVESECMKHTSRIETSPEKRSHINKGKSGKCESSVSLNPVKENHKLPVKQTSRKERSPERENFKTPVRGTSKTPVRVQKKPVRKFIPTSANQEESEYSSDEDYRPEDDILNPYPSQTDGYDSKCESAIDSVINYNINECDFSKISCVETEPDLEKPANAEFSKMIKKNWESKKTNDSMKSIFEKYKSPENCVFVLPKVNFELWKLLSSWQRKSDIKFISIQKSLVRTMIASLSILSEIHSGDFSVQSIAQKTADIAAILGQASHELSLKRRMFIKSVINSEYNDLCQVVNQ